MKNIGDIWQQQPAEDNSMSTKLLQMRAQQLARKTQRDFISVADSQFFYLLSTSELW